ncbi:MAG TPA: 16S rRNA (cytidine(1402)-2'-O)-methyltransferase, partial [Gammaproteobacteria bacterium]|nr:16S rRNA (cytidine(1402)-2'-O)-methyltransferase [Gammaproteobacteria bacterium]
HFDIKTPISAFHDYNEREKCTTVIDKLKQGVSIALISDAGTPLISDPGYVLVSAAKKNSVNVVPIPGPSALIAALSASGVPSDSFSFFGFLPSKQNARIKTLKTFISRPETIIIYESPKRILAALTDMLFVFGEAREVCLAKELTKTFETILTTNIPNLISYIASDPNHQKGEFVLLISSSGKKKQLELDQQLDNLLSVLCSEMGASKAAKLAAKITGIDKKYCYQRAIES